VLAIDRNHFQNQKENFSKGLVHNVDFFVVFHLVGVVIQAGEIQFCPANLVNELEHY
jgi:hypothetical protein